ncbi:unnamed protein product [Ceutorhynchus assimilis]|uniref:Cytosolic beta-glucosidase n=1 Tax=Ceutorhynchus assimilis TaxID=467358 RepID=A0A9N9MMK8_9CUCU|nr:unnamed protein product [Ceutorhynchus assimilis]
MFRLLAICCCILSASSDDAINNHNFPENFSLGVATAAFQIEGAWNADGKGENLWDWFMHKYPEKIEGQANGDVACDSYYQWQEDVKLLRDLGVNHYRLSISWTRILPDGLANNFTLNQKGVNYYRTIFKILLDAGITPYVTLYHWDLPLPLHQLGGWVNPIIADHFAAYARVCFQQFGDLVKNWITINEPQTYCSLGYLTGEHAPGYILPAEAIYKCAYTTVMAHAKAYHIYQDEFKRTQNGRVSIVLDSPWFQPPSDSDEDQLASQRAFDFTLGLYANPIYVGNWPEQVISIVDYRSEMEGYPSSRLPKFTDEEIAYIKGTYDFFCLNSYSTNFAYHQNNKDERIDPDNVSFLSDQGVGFYVDPKWPSEVDWVNLVPSGFRKLIKYVHDTYNQPEIFITENGWAQNSTTSGTEDPARITYIKQYLSAALDAIYIDGANVTGYTVWSLMDNLEWDHGYQIKMGLVQVDFESVDRTRTPKASYTWYQNIIKNRCLADNVNDCTS